jgi:pyruvate formate lyase activating enzyme
MKICGLAKLSTIDYPSELSSVLFTPGCNFNCFYCHNRSLLGQEHELIPLPEINGFLKKRHGMIDGVVISGGEPTLQNDLIPYLRSLKNMGFLVKLDTNGSRPDVISEILKHDLADYIAVDYKAPFSRYPEICRADASGMIETISLLRSHETKWELRTTVIPQLSLSDLLQMASEVDILPRFTLKPYRKPDLYLPEDKFRVDLKPYTAAQLYGFAERLEPIQPNTVVME